jgi:hypothetical protein
VVDRKHGAIGEFGFAFGSVIAAPAAGGEQAVAPAGDAEAPADGELEAGDRTGAAGDPRDRRQDLEAELASVDADDPGRDDDRGRCRDRAAARRWG